MSEERPIYSIQKTYIIKPASKSEKRLLTCDERIDIPTIEPLLNLKPFVLENLPLTVIPCIELAGEFWSEFNLTFETNEGVTVLPVKIQPGSDNPLENPYLQFRYVLVLPRGATGVKSCKIIHKETGKEVQHNFTFGIMPPPYNYDNVLFGCYTDTMLQMLQNFEQKFEQLHLTTEMTTYAIQDLPKGEGKRTIIIGDAAQFYQTSFNYPLSSEPTIHKPKITLRGNGRNQVYTLSLNKTKNAVSIDLFTGMIRVCDVNGEIVQQFMLEYPHQGFENFDDINAPSLIVEARGARVK